MSKKSDSHISTLSLDINPLHLQLTGWLFFLTIVAIFIGLGLFKLFVFLLFTYLINDLLVRGLGYKMSSLSKRTILFTAYTLMIIAIVIIVLIVIPKFVREFPGYQKAIESALQGQLLILADKYDVSIDITKLKEKAYATITSHLGETLNFVKKAGMNALLLVIATIISFILMHRIIVVEQSSAEPVDDKGNENNLFYFLMEFSVHKVKIFYFHFKTVMSAQVIISLINAGLTFIMLLILGIPHKLTLIVLVFIFGLLPVIGNLISNVIICSAALVWAGQWQFFAALTFLVVIHKLEYLLNSKIIGTMVKLPMAVTLLALIVGEGLFKISGMILAIPLVLFIKGELESIKINADHG